MTTQIKPIYGWVLNAQVYHRVLYPPTRTSWTVVIMHTRCKGDVYGFTTLDQPAEAVPSTLRPCKTCFPKGAP